MKKQLALIALILAAMVTGYFVGNLIPLTKKKDQDTNPMEAMMKAMMNVTVNAIEVRETELEQPTKHIAMVEPVEDAAIRAEIAGYIEQIHFTEGSMVQEGDLLFTIDPAQYRAAVASAAAELAQAEAALDQARRFNERMKKVDPRSISQNDLDQAESELLRAEAGKQRAEAALETARINLARTEIRAPISGRIGAAELTKGNYATPAAGVLARIVRLDPIRVVFSLTDREYLALRRQELHDEPNQHIARIRLTDGSTLDAIGEKDFDDNAVNPNTGTIAVRYRFDNPNGLLVPGSYTTALLHKRNTEKGILIPQRAVLGDSQGYHVLTIAKDGTVASAPVQTGAQIGTQVVIENGLVPGDRVVIDGVQKAQPGMPAKFVLVEE